MTSVTGKSGFVARPQGGFSLVELLTVVAIMAVVMGLVAVGVSGMQRPGLQTAAAQVSSWMSLARQLAISRNTAAAFVIATSTNGANMPAEPFKYWAVITSNRGTNTWTLRKDWEKLPDGAVFVQTLAAPPGSSPATTYNSLTANTWPSGISVGVPAVPPGNSFVNSTLYSNTVAPSGSSLTFAATPAIVFKNDGTATTDAVAVRLADGAVDGSGQVILRNNTRYYFVETDANTGRIRVRAQETYQ